MEIGDYNVVFDKFRLQLLVSGRRPVKAPVADRRVVECFFGSDSSLPNALERVEQLVLHQPGEHVSCVLVAWNSREVQLFALDEIAYVQQFDVLVQRSACTVRLSNRLSRLVVAAHNHGQFERAQQI